MITPAHAWQCATGVGTPVGRAAACWSWVFDCRLLDLKLGPRKSNGLILYSLHWLNHRYMICTCAGISTRLLSIQWLPRLRTACLTFTLSCTMIKQLRIWQLCLQLVQTIRHSPCDKINFNVHTWIDKTGIFGWFHPYIQLVSSVNAPAGIQGNRRGSSRVPEETCASELDKNNTCQEYCRSEEAPCGWGHVWFSACMCKIHLGSHTICAHPNLSSDLNNCFEKDFTSSFNFRVYDVPWKDAWKANQQITMIYKCNYNKFACYCFQCMSNAWLCRFCK